MIVHVDDFMCAFHELFDIDIIDGMFTWGSVTIIDEDHPGVYRGKEISLVQENDRFKYQVTQTTFIDGMDSGRLLRGRSRIPERLRIASVAGLPDKARAGACGQP